MTCRSMKEDGTVSEPGTGDARPWRLGSRTRKGVLVVHIASAGAWIGIDVVMGLLRDLLPGAHPQAARD
jgi:hypothetical protein